MSDLPTWVTDPQAVTPPLDEYLAAEKEEPNLFWMIPSGYQQNLLAEAVAQRDEARAEVDRLSAQVRHWMNYGTGQNDEANALAAELEELRGKLNGATSIVELLESMITEIQPGADVYYWTTRFDAIRDAVRAIKAVEAAHGK